MTKVITYGTYDLLHHGHLALLARARALGNYLVVGLSSDEFNQVKGKRCVFDFARRREMLYMLRMVDEVIPETCWEQKYTDIQRHQIDTFVMGDDWVGKFDDLREFCNVVYLPRTPGISTTMLKQSAGIL